MPIANQITDYTGRTRDISILSGVDASGVRKPVELKFGEISQFCAGIQKLVQRYVISFLTIAGSQVNFPTFGTDFLASLISSNNNPSQIDVEHVFNFANFSVITLFRDYQSQNTDLQLDEQISTASLNKVVITAGQVSFDIKIVSLAGDVVDFIIPLPETK